MRAMTDSSREVLRGALLALASVVLCLAQAGGASSPSEERREKTPAAYFYEADSLYAKGEFQKAIDEYSEILNKGYESGSLYYDIGNAYFKLGDLGRAILYYERARTLIPLDADLKTNLEYAQSLMEESGGAESRRWWMKYFENLTAVINLRDLALLLSAGYLLIVFLFAAHIVYRDRIKKRLVIPLVLLAAALLRVGSSFGARLYERELLRPAIVLAKEAECRFEPFDTSTVYFKVYAGNKVYVLISKESWSKIRRPDGKMAWLKNDAIERI
jgi:tetratricopeptide (TPR) repeat protein